MQLFPLLREWGATGLLIEWEDTFPYIRDLTFIGSNGPCPAGAYTAEEARELLKLAGDSGLAVVPLVQTIGHLEVIHVAYVSECCLRFYKVTKENSIAIFPYSVL